MRKWRKHSEVGFVEDISKHEQDKNLHINLIINSNAIRKKEHVPWNDALYDAFDAL